MFLFFRGVLILKQFLVFGLHYTILYDLIKLLLYLLILNIQDWYRTSFVSTISLDMLIQIESLLNNIWNI